MAGKELWEMVFFAVLLVFIVLICVGLTAVLSKVGRPLLKPEAQWSNARFFTSVLVSGALVGALAVGIFMGTLWGIQYIIDRV